jgi:hypothetical protein
MSGNEASAIGSIRTISSAQATYASACGGGGYDVSAAATGLATEPVVGSPAFIPADLAGALDGTAPKSGYEFVNGVGPAGEPVLAADICDSALPTETQFFAAAAPLTPGQTGVRYFGTDNSGQIRQRTDAAVTAITDGQPLQ